MITHPHTCVIVGVIPLHKWLCNGSNALHCVLIDITLCNNIYNKLSFICVAVGSRTMEIRGGLVALTDHMGGAPPPP